MLAAAGCMSDVTTLRRMLGARLTQYEHSHATAMSSSAISQLLSVTLYYRRFFPYYAFCMVGGLDEEGKGAVYGYDAVGSYKRDDYGVMGSGQNYLMPILDNLVSSRDALSLSHAPLFVHMPLLLTPLSSPFLAADWPQEPPGREEAFHCGGGGGHC